MAILTTVFQQVVIGRLSGVSLNLFIC